MTRIRNSRLCRFARAGAITAGLAMSAAPAHADEQTVKLIQILIAKGILTKAQAGDLIRETGGASPHGKRGSAAATGAAADTEAPPAPAKKGEIRVTYVPQFVRKQIADEVRAQVMGQVQTEGWAEPNALPEWTKRVRVFGEIRARYESDVFNRGNYPYFYNLSSINNGNPFDIESYANGTGANPPYLNTTENRTRFRLRARFGAESDLSPSVTANIRIGTGDPNGPVATNATLGQNGAFSKYAIYLDRAYVAFHPYDSILLEAGRTANPFSTSDILFYSDLGFDGVSARVQHDIVPGLKASITGGAFPLFNTDFAFSTNDPQKFASTDSYLFAGQAAASWKMTHDLTARLAVGFFDFTGVQGAVSNPCVEQPGSVYYCNTDDTRYLNGQFGNTLYAIRNIVPNGTTTPINPQYFGLASRFAVLEVHPQFDIDTYAPINVHLEADFIKNMAFNRAAIIAHGPANGPIGPQNNYGSTATGVGTGPYQGGDTGYMVKLAVGNTSVKHLWDWNLSAAYKYIASDATLDSLDDAEFHLGGTNARGYVLQGVLGVADNTNVSLRWLSSQVVSGPPDGNDVVLLDLNASF
jgi:hypothetical protein